MCESKPTVWFCPSDQANLCESCDEQLHSSNQIFARHQRVRVDGTASAPPPPTTPPVEDSIVQDNGNSQTETPNTLAEKMRDELQLDDRPALGRDEDIAGTSTKNTGSHARLVKAQPTGTLNKDGNKQGGQVLREKLADTFALLETAFAEGLVDQKQFMHLLELDNFCNFKFVLKIIEWYMQDQTKMITQLHALCVDPETCEYRLRINSTKMRFLLHKLRGSSSNAGATAVIDACQMMREHCTEGTTDSFINGPGNYHNLKVACDKVNALFVVVSRGLREYLVATGDTETASSPAVSIPALPPSPEEVAATR